MWLAWNKLYNRVPVSDKEIQNESLWNNERVLVGEKVVHWKGSQRVGVIKVADLISERGEFMDRAMIEETYGIKCNFLEVMQIRNAIPWIRAGPIVV